MSGATARDIFDQAPARRGGWGDAIFAALCHAAGGFVLVLLGGIILTLFLGGLPAFRAFGVGFLWSTEWDPVQEIFGAGVSIYGTVVTAMLAITMAVPLAFGIAVTLTHLAPVWMRGPIGTAVELLAAVPSIIYGMWGFYFVVPFMANTIQPILIDGLGGVAIIGSLFQGPPFGTGIFTAALILAIMILPFIAATARDAFNQVPTVHQESAYALGCTTTEVVRDVVLPYANTAVAGGVMLGLGRALGETMAVTFVIGNANRISTSLFASGNTVASQMALEFGETETGSLKLAALLALGFMLFVISFIVLALSRLLLRPRSEQAVRKPRAGAPREAEPSITR
ncbi:MAG: phosphate ABC transporter permease subunit PstC [Acetobacteraceae bacterium]|nr:phosphate ABC transporter permease subunit PstC [Acetobacteraceae bacterium]MSP30923.1 phosphate ABC transporter permease subunit PstC [Acetobacteraceae bacterium]